MLRNPVMAYVGHKSDSKMIKSMSEKRFSIYEHQSAFLETVRQNGKLYGLPGTIERHLEEAVRACPRHVFVNDYKPLPEGPIRRITEDNIESHFATIYSDTSLAQIDSAGHQLPSTNSQPSLILHLLNLLDLQPGQKVLEVGSGSGWLLAIMARLVGEDGHAYGVEIIDSLADRSRDAIRRCGIANATVSNRSGSLGWKDAAPFDRIIFTTGVWDLPAPVFDEISSDGLLLAPFKIKGPGEDVLLLRRNGSGFEIKHSVPAYFVPMVGDVAPIGTNLSEMALWNAIKDRKVAELPSPFGKTLDGFMHGSRNFRSFMTKTEPRFFVSTERSDNALNINSSMSMFGIADAHEQSLALVSLHGFEGFGTLEASKVFFRGFNEWSCRLMPGAEVFDGFLTLASNNPPKVATWTEPRGNTVFHWRLKADCPDVRVLEDHDAASCRPA